MLDFGNKYYDDIYVSCETLFTLAAKRAARHFNNSFVETNIPMDLKASVLHLPKQCVLELSKFLHYRHLAFLLQQDNKDSSLAHLPPNLEKYFPLSMQREELAIMSGHISDDVALINLHDPATLATLCFTDDSDIPPLSDKIRSERILRPNEVWNSTYSMKDMYMDQGAIDPGGDPLTPEQIAAEFLKPQTAPHCIVPTIEDFQRRFDRFTYNQLTKINWDNVIVSGGAILGCLLGSEDSDAYSSSDIDLFLYGLPSREAANAKLIALYRQISAAFDATPVLDDEKKKKKYLKLRATVTPFSLTMYRGHPYRCVQVNLSMYRTKADVLSRFDVDAVAVCFDGKRVEALPRFVRAVRTRNCVMNGNLWIANYERIRKYRARGFAFSLPKFVALNHDNRSSFAKPEKLIEHLSAVAKMRLLDSREDIWFCGDTCLLKWLTEFKSGICAGESKRAVLYDETDSEYPSGKKNFWRRQRKTRPFLLKHPLEAEGSCGMYYIKYYPGVSGSELEGELEGSIHGLHRGSKTPGEYTAYNVTELEKLVDAWKAFTDEQKQDKQYWFGKPCYDDLVLARRKGERGDEEASDFWAVEFPMFSKVIAADDLKKSCEFRFVELQGEMRFHVKVYDIECEDTGEPRKYISIELISPGTFKPNALCREANLWANTRRKRKAEEKSKKKKKKKQKTEKELKPIEELLCSCNFLLVVRDKQHQPIITFDQTLHFTLLRNVYHLKHLRFYYGDCSEIEFVCQMMDFSRV